MLRWNCVYNIPAVWTLALFFFLFLKICFCFSSLKNLFMCILSYEFHYKWIKTFCFTCRTVMTMSRTWASRGNAVSRQFPVVAWACSRTAIQLTQIRDWISSVPKKQGWLGAILAVWSRNNNACWNRRNVMKIRHTIQVMNKSCDPKHSTILNIRQNSHSHT